MKIHEYNEIRIIEEDCIKYTNGILFLGFSGIGMVGLTTTDILNQLLNMKETGRIRCALIPPIVLFEDGLMRHPNLLMSSESRQCAGMIFCVPPPKESYYLLADFIITWAEQHGISQIITITSFESESPASEVLIVAEKENYEKMITYGGSPLKTGKIEGFQAAILEASLLSPIDASILAVETKEQKPDLKKIQSLVEMFLKIAEIEISSEDIDKFLEEYNSALKFIFESG